MLVDIRLIRMATQDIEHQVTPGFNRRMHLGKSCWIFTLVNDTRNDLQVLPDFKDGIIAQISHKGPFRTLHQASVGQTSMTIVRQLGRKANR